MPTLEDTGSGLAFRSLRLLHAGSLTRNTLRVQVRGLGATQRATEGFRVEIARKAVTVFEGTPVCLYGIAYHMALDCPLLTIQKGIIHFRVLQKNPVYSAVW